MNQFQIVTLLLLLVTVAVPSVAPDMPPVLAQEPENASPWLRSVVWRPSARIFGGVVTINGAEPVHKIAFIDERGEIFSADGEIAERILRVLTKHQDAACARQSSLATNDRDLYLKAAITYAELYRDMVDSLLKTGFVQGKNTENMKAIRQTAATTIERFTEIRTIYRKDRP